MKTNKKHWLSPQILMIALLCVAASFGAGIKTTGDVQTVMHTNAAETERMSGDMNMDAKVDLSDTIEMLEIVRGYKVATVEQLKNEPSEDGLITIDDVIMTLRDIHNRAL